MIWTNNVIFWALEWASGSRDAILWETWGNWSHWRNSRFKFLPHTHWEKWRIKSLSLFDFFFHYFSPFPFFYFSLSHFFSSLLSFPNSLIRVKIMCFICDSFVLCLILVFLDSVSMLFSSFPLFPKNICTNLPSYYPFFFVFAYD